MNKIFLSSFLFSLLIHCVLFVQFKPFEKTNKSNVEIGFKQGSVFVKKYETVFIKSHKKTHQNIKKEVHRKMLRSENKGVISLHPDSKFEVNYPYLSKIHNEEGIVRIKIFVDLHGKLKKYKILKSPFFKRLVSEAIRVVKAAKYLPVFKNGKFVSSVGIKEFVFKLTN